MMDRADRTNVGRLSVDTALHRFIEHEALTGTGIEATDFWQGFDQIVRDLAPRNRELLARRDELQAQIDEWHALHPFPFGRNEYRTFLEGIGYILPEPEDVQVLTTGVDKEIAGVAGPQLVVPVSNARYALNAANARWGSLYDALYGTDALAPATGVKGYDAARGTLVVSYVRGLLDEFFPLTAGHHSDSAGYTVRDGMLRVELADGTSSSLAQPELFAGYLGETGSPSAILLRTMGSTSSSLSTPQHRSDRRTRQVSPTSSSNPPSQRSSTSRIQYPPWTPMTRSSVTAIGSGSIVAIWQIRSKKATR